MLGKNTEILNFSKPLAEHRPLGPRQEAPGSPLQSTPGPEAAPFFREKEIFR